jgi:hypothetical protein
LFHLKVCCPDTANPIDNIVALSKSDTANQIEEEITEASALKIARTERLARNAETAIGKKHTSSRDRDSGHADSDEDGGDGIASGGGGTTPSLTSTTTPKDSGNTLSLRLDSPRGTWLN